QVRLAGGGVRSSSETSACLPRAGGGDGEAEAEGLIRLRPLSAEVPRLDLVREYSSSERSDGGLRRRPRSRLAGDDRRESSDDESRPRPRRRPRLRLRLRLRLWLRLRELERPLDEYDELEY